MAGKALAARGCLVHSGSTGAEDRATRGRDLSADCGARMGAAGNARRPTLFSAYSGPICASVHSCLKALNPGVAGAEPPCCGVRW